MKNIEGVYKVEMLGPYGWERFSTAFIHDGNFRSASADHFTDGHYAVEGESFNMTGNLTQFVEHRPLFGENEIKDLPINFRGKINKDVIDGEAKAEGGRKYKLRFRFNKLPVLN
jgi:hypothetical protein